MKYVTTIDILVDGDLHKAGDVLRSTAQGSVDSMLRLGQIKPFTEPATPPEPKIDKSKKADK